MEVDHIFICSELNAPEAEVLLDFGLIEGSSNNHPGQGTANRRFFFHNLMIELLWVENIEEVQSSLTEPMRLYERCIDRDDGVSPFGIGLRPTEKENIKIKFWDYHPQYLPESLTIRVADNTPLSEPLYFYLSFADRQDNVSIKQREPMEHKKPFDEVTNIIAHINSDIALSNVGCELNKLEGLSVVVGKENYLELEFDDNHQKKYKDFRPILPLIFKW